MQIYNAQCDLTVILISCCQCLTTENLATVVHLDGIEFDSDEFDRASVVLLYFLSNGDNVCQTLPNPTGESYSSYLQWLMGNASLYTSVEQIFNILTRDDGRGATGSHAGVSETIRVLSYYSNKRVNIVRCQ